MITFDDFQKLDIRIGKILSAEKLEGTDKLLRLQIDFGSEKRQIISGIAEFYSPEDIAGKECPFVFNLEPKKFRGQESQGMIMTVDADGGCILLHPDKEVKPGARIA